MDSMVQSKRSEHFGVVRTACFEQQAVVLTPTAGLALREE